VAYANGGESVIGRTRFQKIVFVIQNQAKFYKERYHFMAHDFGPYSTELQKDIDDLIHTGFLRENKDTIDEGKIRYQYVITPVGATTLNRILGNGRFDRKFRFKRVLASASKVKAELNRRDLNSLLSDIYTRYPEYAKYSKYKF
jgi:uncharacterized protein YwgA